LYLLIFNYCGFGEGLTVNVTVLPAKVAVLGCPVTIVCAAVLTAVTAVPVVMLETTFLLVVDTAVTLLIEVVVTPVRTALGITNFSPVTVMFVLVPPVAIV
jgi:hypothetical protein